MTLATLPQDLERHPLSALCGEIPEDENKKLAADVKKNGVLNPIVLYEGKILDGWHRYNAAKKSGAPCAEDARDFENHTQAADFVLSSNLHRRHLTPGARAKIVVSVRKWKPEGRPKTTSPDVVLPEAEQHSEKQMAEEAHVSVPTVQRAKSQSRGKASPKPKPKPNGSKPDRKIDSVNAARFVDSLELEKRGLVRDLDAAKNKIKALEEAIDFLKKDQLPHAAQREKVFNSLREAANLAKHKAWEWQTKHNQLQKENKSLNVKLKAKAKAK